MQQQLRGPQPSPTVDSSHTAWLLVHAGTFPSMMVQENDQDNSSLLRLQASRPALQLFSSSHTNSRCFQPRLQGVTAQSCPAHH